MTASLIRDRAIALAIFATAFAFYMLTSGREPAWSDAASMWDIADRIVSNGSIDTKVRWPDDAPKGSDGKYYGITPIGTSLVHVPGAGIARIAHGISPRHDVLSRPLSVHLAPAALGALACALFFLLLRDLGIGARVASVTTVILACATTTWVYARMPYSEILQLACFLGLFRATLRVSAAPVVREALWWGAWAGCLFESKYVFAIAIAGAAAVIAWTLRKQRGELVRVAKWAAVSGVPFVVLALWYNWARWDSVASTGYEPYLDQYFGGSAFDGAWGMLLSPNKSAFLYSPPLVLALIAMPSAFRAVPRLGLAMLLMVVSVFLVYATYRSWSGEWAWGPRFFVWAVPVVLVPIAWFIEKAASRWRRAVVGAVVVGGVAVQLLGCALYWDTFIRISQEVKHQWLGQPNRKGAYIPPRGRPHCDSCFEDTYQVLWTPAFHPIRGHWWLVKSIARGDDAKSAQADAPWRGYTTLDFQLADYGRARIDWWGLLWIKDGKDVWQAGVAVLVLVVGGLAFGIWRWLRLVREHAKE